jgi:outer membrane protein assembly factor BamB
MAYSGQKTITAAGTAEALGTAIIDGPLVVKALEGNAGQVYLGNDGAGDVSSTTGLVLVAGEIVAFEFVSSLSNLMLDAANNNDGVAWHVKDGG